MNRRSRSGLFHFGWAFLLNPGAVTPVAADTPIAIEMALVSGSDAQPGGPQHDFRVGVFEVNHAQFGAFLNDALLNLENERGQYLYFDTDSGDVYIHSSLTGTIGTSGSGTLLFDASVTGGLTYETGSGVYQVNAAQEYHPIAGVSWYGAVKFCNWLTLNQGLDAEQRAYLEAPSTNLGGWHPVVITDADWALGDLDDEQRLDWVSQYAGFRLLMDDGAASESLYNEWYKAASWIPTETRNSVYGFGRDAIVPGDANYFCSGDEFETPGNCADGGSSSVGYYDGTLRDPDGIAFQTHDTANGYDLYDVSGNVWEWLSDQRSSPSFRSVRGGSWNSSTSSLKTTAFASSTPGFIQSQGTYGFRVAQSVLNRLTVEPASLVTAVGPFGGAYVPADQTYTLSNLSGTDLALDITPDVAWLMVNGLPQLTGFVVPAYGQAIVTVSWDSDCTQQVPPLGVTHGGVAFVSDGLIPVDLYREIELTVTEPLTLAPEPDTTFSVEGFFDGPFTGTQVQTLENLSDSVISWNAASDEEWLLIDGKDSLSGEIDPTVSESIDLVLSVGPTAETLEAGSYSATLSLFDECTQSLFQRITTLTIHPTIAVEEDLELAFSGVSGGPFEPTTVEIVLTNESDRLVSWEADSDAEWLAINEEVLASGVLAATESVNLAFSVASAAALLSVGEYVAAISIRDVSDPSHVLEISLSALLDVTELDVEPTGDWVAGGPVGGPVTPDAQTYVLTNHSLFEFEWSASSDALWLNLNGQPTASGVILEPEGTATVLAEINSQAYLLEDGVYEATITFVEFFTQAQSVRKVILEIGTLDFTVPTVLVPADSVQPGGPTYDFRIGRFEVTQQEFAAFLNNALYSLNDPRGHYLYHDLDTGDVYLAGTEAGTAGVDGVGTLLFDSGNGNAISYDGQNYVVAEGADAFPVGGVSWYGALKFCNWLTLVGGMGTEQRVYHEGPTPGDWFPVTIGTEIGGSQAATYAVRDLSDEERGLLVALYPGFRLPMDGGVSAAGAYNEWYKASAMGLDGLTDKVYGFGRNVINPADANYSASGDSYEPDATPIQYYDGTQQGGIFNTEDTSNLFGIYDLCGNVREWVQDHGFTASERGLRGGHFQSAADSVSLRNDVRSSRSAQDLQIITGFRIAQSLAGQPLAVEGTDAIAFVGPFGGDFEPDAAEITLRNPGILTRTWSLSADASWLTAEADGATAGALAPGEAVSIQVSLSEDAETVLPFVQDDADGVQIPATDEEPGGPNYTYWIGRYETTRGEFVEFLNEAIDHFAQERGAYLYIDESSGDVYLNDEFAGAIGPMEGTGDHVLLFEVFPNSGVTFDGSKYDVTPEFADHPVVAVSWLGAVKYCNWLTLNRGYSLGQRCYTEGPYPGDWHPVTIRTVDWWGTEDTAANAVPLAAARDLNDTERSLLATSYFGFRLPMDGGVGPTHPFNEWYKAAAWRSQPVPSQAEFQARGGGVHHTFGFGRDLLTPFDAHHGGSSNAWTGSTAPVGSFDGTVYDADGAVDADSSIDDGDFPSAADSNSYGLFDTCGNAAEWVQDRDALLNPVTRGGSWSSDSASPQLQADVRTRAVSEIPSPTTGFRVAQSRRGYEAVLTVTDETSQVSIDVPITLVVDEPLSVTPFYGLDLTAKYGEDLTDFALDYQLYNTSVNPIDCTTEASADWITLSPPGMDEIELPSEASQVITIQLNESAAELPPGDHTAVITFTDLATGFETERRFSVSVAPSMEFTPETDAYFSGYWGGPFAPVEVSYNLLNSADQQIAFGLSAVDDWIAIHADTGETTGNLPVGGTAAVVVTPAPSAIELPVGTYTTDLSVTDTTSGFVVTRMATLDVLDPLEITHDALESSGPYGGPLTPQSFDVTLANRGGLTLDWEAVSDTGWLLINGEDSAGGSLETADSEILLLTLTDEAALLPEGVHKAVVSILDYQSGYTQYLEVSVTVDEGLSVTPSVSSDFYAPVGGSSDPAYVVYRLVNLDADLIQYEVSSDPPWVLLSGSNPLGGTLDVGDTVNVVVTVDEAQTAVLPPGDYSAVLNFTNLSTGFGSTTRTLQLHLVAPTISVNLEGVTADMVQPNGPQYEYQIGRHEVTKSQFAAFLNNAVANLDNERGHYLYFDTDSGDVYIHSDSTGALGTAGAGTLIFDLSIDGRITFDGSQYSVDPAYADHPAVGMSWYGAVKFCNWLTVDQGLSPQRRCYLEGPGSEVLTAWRPVVIDASDWAGGDLDDGQRAALVVGYSGFRLPMDDGSGNSDPAKDAADAYNEWYKAASWNAALSKNTLYGFGRDTFSGADANYLGSGDPFESGTTPTGYYDGSNHGGAFPTNDTSNTAGLYDLSGNVAEWVQDRYVGTATSSIRGGSFAVSLKDVNVRSANFPNSPNFTVGMRILRVSATLPGDFDADGDLDLLDLGQLQSCFTGSNPGTLPVSCASYDTDHDADVDLEDFAYFQSTFSGPNP